MLTVSISSLFREILFSEQGSLGSKNILRGAQQIVTHGCQATFTVGACREKEQEHCERAIGDNRIVYPKNKFISHISFMDASARK